MSSAFYIHEARNNVQVESQEEKNFKEAIKATNPRMGLAQISNINAEQTETKFGKNPVGSFSSYQLTHTVDANPHKITPVLQNCQFIPLSLE